MSETTLSVGLVVWLNSGGLPFTITDVVSRNWLCPACDEWKITQSTAKHGVRELTARAAALTLEDPNK